MRVRKTSLREVKPKAFTYASSEFNLVNRGALGSTGGSCAITFQDVGGGKSICRDQKSSGELEEVEREVMGANGSVYLIVVVIRNEARVMVDHILV